MADSPDDAANNAEKAYAAAAAEAKSPKPAEPKPASEPVPAPVARKAAVTKKSAAPAKPATDLAQKTAPKRQAAIAKAKAAKRAARVAKAAAAPAKVVAAEPKLSVTELKEKIMATAAKTPDYTKPLADTFGEFQSRAKDAYDKGTEAMTEITEFTKGNVEALVESSKIFAAGAQSLGKTYAEEAKSAYETLTADVKEMAAVKTPAELFQLQGKIMRRNFDALVATGSKNTEAVIKLANDTFAPLTGRVEVATEKLAKVA